MKTTPNQPPHMSNSLAQATIAPSKGKIMPVLSAAGLLQLAANQHPDDLAVDAFAVAMKAKMAEARAKGRGGWEDPAQCSADDLSRMLRDHVEKGDPRDVANFCMMLQQRGEAIACHQPVGQEQLVPHVVALELIGDAYNAGGHGIGYSQQAMELHDAIVAPPAQAVIPEGWALVDLAEYAILPHLPGPELIQAGWPESEFINDEFDTDGAYADLIAACPASGTGIVHGVAQPAQAAGQEPVEMSPEFTDTARAAIAWVLWHHQGGSSPVGQPLRFALGMGQHERMTDQQIAEARRFAAWAGASTEGFHQHKTAQAVDVGRARDAERYRWLRDHYDPSVHDDDGGSFLRQSGEELDAAIDSQAGVKP